MGGGGAPGGRLDAQTTHAILDRLHRYYLEPSNVDVYVFHEGFAGIVAKPPAFLPAGLGKALRSARDEKPDPTLYRTAFEPHERGAVLVAAVFDAFFEVYRRPGAHGKGRIDVADPDDLLGGVRHRGGTMVIASVDGRVK